MGATAVKLLNNSARKRVIGVNSSGIFDMDLEEAISIKKIFDETTYELTKILSI